MNETRRRKNMANDIKWKEHDSAPMYYANVAEISTSRYDFRVRLGQIQDDGSAATVATIYMAPGHVEALIAALQNQMSRYKDRVSLTTGRR